ncbi:MAG: 50S ribosomal protein L20 [Patescibacteria group bacterium]|nr:50S ribosomal protein L20 [Patescibacteria group bacterium]MDD5490766.1 50S ribosomal protein L20 [Patescibacteria group bacterium]
MSRVKRGKAHLKRRKNLLKKAKGYKWGRKSKIKLATTAVLKAGAYAYRDRRNKKRAARSLWQVQLNATARESGLSYSKLMGALKKRGVGLDRKILADLANNDPEVFKKIVAGVK